VRREDPVQALRDSRLGDADVTDVGCEEGVRDRRQHLGWRQMAPVVAHTLQQLRGDRGGGTVVRGISLGSAWRRVKVVVGHGSLDETRIVR
jgi:hypothetical protein